MRMGTTPTHIFTLPEELAGAIAKVRVIYKQQDAIVLKKEMEAVQSNVVSFKLTQEETLLFVPGEPVYIQVRVLTKEEESLVSNIFSVDVYRCLENEVLA